VIVQINDTFRIRASGLQPCEFTLQRRKDEETIKKLHEKHAKGESKTKVQEWTNIGYFGQLNHALIRMLDYLVADSEEHVSIRELVKILDNWKTEITAATLQK